ncbi:MAG: energy transducer TonB [Candidatus Acidiferrales bacterium]
MSSGQPTPLEMPVTVQGATPIEGTDRRELFTETAKTTLVFENGAVVNLKAKVVQGQCVFLRNERSGREILCRVVEWRKGGVGGYADLEFTSRDPVFWEVTDEQAAQVAAAQQKAAAPAQTPAEIIARAQAELAASTAKAAPEAASGQSSEAAAGATPAVPAETSAAAPVPAAPETRAPASGSSGDSANETRKISPEKLELTPASEPAPEPEWNDEQSAKMFATLMASDPKPKAKKEPAASSTEDAHPAAATESAAAPENGEQHPDAATVATGNGKGISRIAAWSFQLREFGPGKKTVAIGIAASVLFVAALGLAWHIKRKHSLSASDGVLAASVPSSTAHAPAASSAASSSGSKTPAATVVNVAATSTPATAPAQPASKSQPVDSAKAAAELAARRNHESDLRVLGELPPGKSKDKNSSAAGLVPAKILSQAPPAIPEWAKKLDLNPVVQLDAVIDSNGNLVSTRPIAGPRILYGEAQRAVALWVFQPAMNDGKPTATHLTLTVEFQH